MIAQGNIVRIDGPLATVELCLADPENCGACISSCDAVRPGKVFEIDSDGTMQVGSEVVLDIKMPSPYMAIGLLLVLPLCLLAAGVVVGLSLFGHEGAAFGLGLVLFAAGFSGARLFEIRGRKRGLYRPTVVSVRPPAPEEDP